MSSLRSRSTAIAFLVAAALVTGAGAASAETSVTVVTGSFDDGDTAGSASETVRVDAPAVGMQTGEFAADDMAGSAHETVALVAAPVAPPAPVVRPAEARVAAPTFVAPVTDAAVIARLVRASGLSAPAPSVVAAGLVA